VVVSHIFREGGIGRPLGVEASSLFMITHKTFTSPCSYQTVGPDVTFMWKNIFAIDLHQKQNPYSVFTTLQCKIVDLMLDVWYHRFGSGASDFECNLCENLMGLNLAMYCAVRYDDGIEPCYYDGYPLCIQISMGPQTQMLYAASVICSPGSWERLKLSVKEANDLV